MGERQCQRGHRMGTGLMRAAAVLMLVMAMTTADVLGGDTTMVADIGGYHAVILENDVACVVSSNGKFEETVHMRIKVSNAEGRGYGQVVIGESQFISLKDFIGAVYDAAGKEVAQVKEKDGRKFCGFGSFELYSDNCLRIFPLSTNTFPSVIDYRYTISCSSLKYWGGWTPQTAIPVQHARYTLTTPKDFVYAVKAVGGIGQPVVTEKGGKRVSVWEMKDIAPIKDEECATPSGDDRMSLRFAPSRFTFGEFDFNGADWGSLGRDYYEMIRGSLVLNNEQAAFADSLRRDSGSSEAVFAGLYRALSLRMRYVAVEIGIGGWQPHISSQTYSAGYGDCKDLATLYVSMLRRAGVAAFPALVLIRNAGLTDPSFPALDHFNHVIYFAVIGHDTVWADATCPFCAPGDLPWQDEDIYVLAIDSVAGRIVRTPSSTPEDNMMVRKAVITINTDKSISAAIDFVVRGNPRHWLINQLSFLEKRNQAQVFKEDIFGVSAAFAIDSFTLPAAGDYSIPLTARVYGRLKNGVLNIGRKWYVNVEFLSPFISCETADYSRRTRGLDLAYPKIYCDTFVINFPEFWTAANLPGDTAVGDALGSASRSCRAGENQLIVVQDRKSFGYTIPFERLAEFQAHINKIRAVLTGQIALYEKEE
jgi:hypothetical protein